MPVALGPRQREPGIHVLNGAGPVMIGGTNAGARNVISGNASSGVDLNGASGSSLLGNYIGVVPAAAWPSPMAAGVLALSAAPMM